MKQIRCSSIREIYLGIAFGVYLLCILLYAKGANALELDVNEIISKAWLKYRQVEDEKERARIILKYKDGRKIIKEHFRWIQFSADGKDKVAIKFTLPVSDRGLSLLTWRDPLERDVHWLKKPSLKNIRRLTVKEESEYFGGIDVTFEDIRQSIGEKQGDFLYQLLENDEEFWEIEALPKNAIATGYAKRIFWIDKQFVLRKVEYYTEDDALLKLQYNRDIDISDDGRWRANRVEIENLLLGRTTFIEIIERQINSQLPASIFAKGFLLVNMPAETYQKW